MRKYIGLLIPDQENLGQIEWCFVIGLEWNEKDFITDDGSYAIGTHAIDEWYDYIGEYDSDAIYAEKKDLRDNFNDACKDILRDLF